MVHVIIYGKTGCHLCQDVTIKIEKVRERVPFDLDKIDIRSDEALTQKYLFDIPVVTINGNVEYTTFLNEIQFEAKLKELSQH